MNVVDIGSIVWVDINVGYYLPGTVVTVLGSHFKVRLEDNKEIYTVNSQHVKPLINHGANGYEDMIKMEDLHEGSILYNMKRRYKNGFIYTYIGHILMSVNPYKMFDIYGLDKVKEYEGKTIGEKSPHIFAIGNAAYYQMLKDKVNQVVLISGESGAGKTESSKLLVQYLAAVNQAKGTLITEQIIEATPLLESFGNAKTVKNDNSSRFGKYLEVYFDKQGCIIGAKISVYLLERSRIVGQASGERNYHIFYEMLAGLPDVEKQKYSLKNAENYAYLNQGRNASIPGKNDVQDFCHLVAAMEVLRISKDDQDGIFTILSAILHLGNVVFGKRQVDGQDTVFIQGDEETKISAELLGLKVNNLLRGLTHKLTEARGEQFMTPRSQEQAYKSRDALSKALYSRLFGWLVKKANGVISKAAELSLAILDIFGFEDFLRNNFEQLCINYANESLQYFFNQSIFTLEQEEYQKEGLQWKWIRFPDNSLCLELIGGTNAGILHLLSDETTFPKSTDHTFLEKCYQRYKHHKCFEKPKTHKLQFGIRHYAGTVWYTVDKFLDKNRDGLRKDLVDLIASCKEQFVFKLFPELQSYTGSAVVNDLDLPRNQTLSRGHLLNLNSPQKSTVAAKFHESLGILIQKMKECNPFFIRCIKPNNEKSPMLLQTPLILEQLRYSGVLETVRIRKLGYPIRYDFLDFLRRYRGCCGLYLRKDARLSDKCLAVLRTVVGQASVNSFQLGHTKVFLSESLSHMLEEVRIDKINQAAVVLQKHFRRVSQRKRFLQMRKAAVLIQSFVRTWRQRRKYKKIRSGFIKMQAAFRARLQRKKFHAARDQFRKTKAIKKAEENAALERKERDRGSVGNVTQLEITTDLALVFTKLPGWEFSNLQNSVVQVTDNVIKHNYRVSHLPEDVDSFKFSKFSQLYFQDQKEWKFTKFPIRNSFLKLKLEESALAVSTFKLILRFMSDWSILGPREFTVANYIIQTGIRSGSLRDEIFSQLINQTWGNGVEASVDRGWLLIALCLCCFTPSDNMGKYVLKHASDNAYNGYKNICQHKQLCWDKQRHLVHRAHPPCILEWTAIKQKSNMALQVHSTDGEKIMIEVASASTGDQLAGKILKERGVVEYNGGWSIDMINNDYCYYTLAGSDYVMDMISELEYPPSFPVTNSPSLITVDMSYNVSPNKIQVLENLHKQRERQETFSDISKTFLDGDYQTTLPDGIQKDDKRFTQVLPPPPKAAPPIPPSLIPPPPTVPPPIPPSAPSTIPQAPPPPPLPRPDNVPPGTSLYVPPPPPPPPPPPIQDPLEAHLKNKVQQGHHKESSAHSLDEIKAKARSMKEVRESVSEIDGRLVNPEEAIDHQIKARAAAADMRALPKEERLKRAYQSELQNAVLKRAQRMNEKWGKEEKKLDLRRAESINKQGIKASELEARASRVKKSWTVPEKKDDAVSGQVYQNGATQGAGGTQEENRSSGDYRGLQHTRTNNLASSDRQAGSSRDYLGSSGDQAGLSRDYLGSSQDQAGSSRNYLGSSGDQRGSSGKFFGSSEVKPTKKASASIYHHGSSMQGTSGSNMGSSQDQQLPSRDYNRSSALIMGSPRSQDLPTTERGLNEFVDNLFDPVLSSDVLDLSDASRLARSIKGGGGMNPNQNGASASPPVTSMGVTPVAYGNNSVPTNMNGTAFFLVNGSLPNGTISGSGMVQPHGMPYQPMVPGMGGYIPVQYPVSNGYGVQGLGNNVPMMIPMSNGHTTTTPPPPPLQPPAPPPSNNIDHEIERKLAEQERKLAERQKELASISERLEAMKNQQERQLQQQRQQREVDHTQTIISDRITRTKPVKRNNTNTSDYLANKSRYQNVNKPTTQNSNLVNPEQRLKDEPRVTTSATPSHNTGVLDPTNQFINEHTRESSGVAPVILALHKQKTTDLSTTSWTVVMTEKTGRTELYRKCTGPYLTYKNVNWKLYLRKEVFMPNETLSSDVTQHLVFKQIVWDTYTTTCCRMTNNDRNTMKTLLEKYGIYPDRNGTSSPVEEIIIDAAKQLPYYFCRFYKVSKQNDSIDFQYVGVSHLGIQLIKRPKITDQLETIEQYQYEDVVKVRNTNDKITLKTKQKKLHFYTDKAALVKKFIEAFLTVVHEKDAKFVKAKFDYITNESTLLSFKQSDVIKLVAKGNVAEGWLYGELRDREGYFPAEYVIDMNEKKLSLPMTSHTTPYHPRTPSPRPLTANSVGSDPGMLDDGKYSMLEFAMKYFRFGHEMYVMQRKKDGSIRGTIKIMDSIGRAFKGNKRDDQEWTWRNQAELIKFSKSPIQASLLKLDSALHNKKALECFITIMKYMGDYVMTQGEHRSDLIYFLLLTCKAYPELKDEIYCQLIKQITSNKSNRNDSCSNGWRLFIILAAYLQCSDVLRPYLIRFLQATSRDPKREFHGAAATTEMNLLKTLKYGGRRMEPTPTEMEQLVQGRTTKRLPIYLPGGITKVLKVHICSTGYDVIKDLCSEMDLSKEEECNEFGLFTFMEREKSLEPLRANSYVMDVISKLDIQHVDYHMHFRRVVWFKLLRLENKLLIDLVYNQVSPSVKTGDLLGGHSNHANLQNEVALIVSIEYLMQGKRSSPALKDIADLIPSSISSTLRPPQWLLLVQDHYNIISTLSQDECKKKYLDVVKRWQYFGSTFFRVKHCTHPKVARECTLAINRNGVHFLDLTSKETLLSFSFVDIISTRLLVSGERGRQFLDLKCGNLMIQKVTRIETYLGRDIVDLIDMYFKFHNNVKMSGNPLHNTSILP